MLIIMKAMNCVTAVIKMTDRGGAVMEYIALDVHKKYTWARVENVEGARLYESRLAHAHGTIKEFC
jgi:hypothetical protein